jgi:SAM-dependent methyltransferase
LDEWSESLEARSWDAAANQDIQPMAHIAQRGWRPSGAIWRRVHSKEMTMTTTIETPNFTAIKAKQQATWASGDYAVIGTTLQIVGEALCEALDLRAGETVLDVAAGNGNASLAAARRFTAVTSTDYVQALLDKGRARAKADGLTITFREADAEALPFADGSFDVAMSTFGVMFTPEHARAASELLRVTRKGGRIGLANWTPDSFIGQLFKVIGQHLPPAKGLRSPALWGDAGHLATLFEGQKIATRAAVFTFRYHSSAHWLDVFKTWYGPTHKAFAALDATGQAALEADILALIARHDIGAGRGMVVPSAYLEAVITRV